MRSALKDPVMFCRWLAGSIQAGRALFGRRGVGEIISDASPLLTDKPGVEGRDWAGTGVRYPAMNSLTTDSGANCDEASGCRPAEPKEAAAMVRDGVHTTNSSCVGARDASPLASHSGPARNAGMVTIGKMGVSPSGRMVDFFFRTLPGGVHGMSSEEMGGPNSPGSMREGLGEVAGSVGNRAASISRDGERCRRGEGRAGGVEGDRNRCGDAGGEERGDEEQE
jgi:hypothetical protein